MEILGFVLLAIMGLCVVALIVILAPAALAIGAVMLCIWVLWAGLVFVTKLIGG